MPSVFGMRLPKKSDISKIFDEMQEFLVKGGDGYSKDDPALGVKPTSHYFGRTKINAGYEDNFVSCQSWKDTRILSGHSIFQVQNGIQGFKGVPPFFQDGDKTVELFIKFIGTVGMRAEMWK